MASTFAPFPGHPTQSSPAPRRRSWINSRKVRETLTVRFAKCLCSIFLTLLLIVGLIFFILWLSLRPHRPRFHLVALSASDLAGGGSAGSLGSISFNMTDRNSNQKVGIYYDATFGSVLYRDQLVASGPVMFPFYQPPKNTTVIAGQLTGAPIGGGALAAQLSGYGAAGRVELRLELNSTIRFKVKMWDTRRHHLHVECNVVVGSDGNLLPESKDSRCPIYF